MRYSRKNLLLKKVANCPRFIVLIKSFHDGYFASDRGIYSSNFDVLYTAQKTQS